MIAAVELGARSTRKGARLHYGSCCRWSALPLVGKLVTLTEKNAHRVCRLARKAVRAAVEAARDYVYKIGRRAGGNPAAVLAWDRLAALFTLAPTAAAVAAQKAEADAERERIAAEWAAFEAPAAPVKELSAFGAMRAANLRTLPQDASRARRYVNLAA